MEIALWIIVAVLVVGFIFLTSEIMGLKNTMVEVTTEIARVVDNRHSQNERYKEELKEILIRLNSNNYDFLNEINGRLSNNGFDLPQEHDGPHMFFDADGVWRCFDPDDEEPQDIDPNAPDPFYDEETGCWYQIKQNGFFRTRVRVHPPKDGKEAGL